MEGMGKVHFPVTAARPEAQAFIDQGVAQLHSFLYFEAERSFRQAARIDPDCAMAYWGMAMANENNGRRARAFLVEARKRQDRLTPREHLYLDALEAHHKEHGDDKARRQAWLEGLETIVQQHPDDQNAQAWLAMVAWQNGRSDGIGSRQAVDLMIDSVLRAEPMHPGALHYRIHLWDGFRAERALPAAKLFGPAAPGIAHAWHMPGHTYSQLKRYADAAYQQEASARVDHAYMIRERVMPFEIHNYVHNNQWLAQNLGHIGRAHDGIAVARNLVELPRDPARSTKDDEGSAQRAGRGRWAEVLIRYELWDDLLAADASGALDWSDVPAERIARAYALGLAYAARQDKARLAEQVAALKALPKPQGNKPAGAVLASLAYAPTSITLDGALAELEGYQQLAAGDISGAFEHFAKAVHMPAESLARAHLAARNYGLAESIAREAVNRDANQVPPLAAYVEVLHAAGKDDEAQRQYAKLMVLACYADEDLPACQRLAKVAAGWKQRHEVSKVSDDSAANRPVDLQTLGPLTWSPSSAPPLSLTDTDGKTWNLAEHLGKGKNVLVLFYLGGRCAHCLEQLQAFGKERDALAALNTELVAVGTDPVEAAKSLKSGASGNRFPMPLLANPGLEAFKAYHAFDDFEDLPVHGAILIDARGGIRYQRISAEPFMDVAFMKTEVARVNRMLKNSGTH
jgi:peroxiredoxin